MTTFLWLLACAIVGVFSYFVGKSHGSSEGFMEGKASVAPTTVKDASAKETPVNVPVKTGKPGRPKGSKNSKKGKKK